MQTHPGEALGGSRAGFQGYDYDNGSESESAAGASGTLPGAAPNAIPPFAGPERATWIVATYTYKCAKKTEAFEDSRGKEGTRGIESESAPGRSPSRPAQPPPTSAVVKKWTLFSLRIPSQVK